MGILASTLGYPYISYWSLSVLLILVVMFAWLLVSVGLDLDSKQLGRSVAMLLFISVFIVILGSVYTKTSIEHATIISGVESIVNDYSTGLVALKLKTPAYLLVRPKDINKIKTIIITKQVGIYPEKLYFIPLTDVSFKE